MTNISQDSMSIKQRTHKRKKKMLEIQYILRIRSINLFLTRLYMEAKPTSQDDVLPIIVTNVTPLDVISVSTTPASTATSTATSTADSAVSQTPTGPVLNSGYPKLTNLSPINESPAVSPIGDTPIALLPIKETPTEETPKEVAEPVKAAAAEVVTVGGAGVVVPAIEKAFLSIKTNKKFLDTIAASVQSLLKDGKITLSEVPELILCISDAVNTSGSFEVGNDLIAPLIKKLFNFVVENYNLMSAETLAEADKTIDIAVRLLTTTPVVKKAVNDCYSYFCC